MSPFPRSVKQDGTLDKGGCLQIWRTFVLLKLHGERLVLHPHVNLTHENLKIWSLAWNTAILLISNVVQLS